MSVWLALFLLVILIIIHWHRANEIKSLEIQFYRRWCSMWVPVDKLEVGESCAVKVNAVKKSGKIVELGLDEVTLSDGDAVAIAGGVVTAVGEGKADVKAELIANPAIVGVASLTVTDSIVGLEVLLGNEV